MYDEDGYAGLSKIALYAIGGILTHAKGSWNKIKFDKKIQEAYINQILDYQEGQDPDDAADSLAGLCRELRLGHDSLLSRYG